MTPLILRTLDGLSLEAAAGPVRINDRIALGLLCLIRLDPSATLEETQAHRHLVPDLPRAEASHRIAAAIEAIARATGVPLVTLERGSLRVDPTQLECDVERTALPLAAPTTRFLSGFNLPPTAEFRTWAEEMRRQVRPRPGVAPPQRRLPDAASTAIFVASWLLVAAVYATRSTPPPGFTPGQVVRLAEVHNTTDDPKFDRSLRSVAEAALGQFPGLASGSAGTRFAVTIGIDSATEGFRLWATLSDTAQPAPIASFERTTTTASEATGVIDDLIDRIRAALGERPTERHARKTTRPEPEAP